MLGRIMVIQSWSQLISFVLYISIGFAVYFIGYQFLIGQVTRRVIFLPILFGVIGASIPLLHCIPAILRITLYPQGYQYWIGRIDESLGRYGYRETMIEHSDGALKHYMSVVPNVLLPQSRRGPARSRPFVPRWARWRENEVRIYITADHACIDVIGPRRLLDRIHGDL
jgi:hypothetical protein